MGDGEGGSRPLQKYQAEKFGIPWRSFRSMLAPLAIEMGRSWLLRSSLKMMIPEVVVDD